MDSAIDVPLLRTKVGLDALLGVVPVAGDLLSAAIGVYLITQARELGASRWLQGKMIGNLVLDAAVGAVPLAGDVFDIYFRAHRRNLKLLQQHLGEPYLDAVGDDADIGDANQSVQCAGANYLANRTRHDANYDPRARGPARRLARQGEARCFVVGQPCARLHQALEFAWLDSRAQRIEQLVPRA